MHIHIIINYSPPDHKIFELPMHACASLLAPLSLHLQQVRMHCYRNNRLRVCVAIIPDTICKLHAWVWVACIYITISYSAVNKNRWRYIVNTIINSCNDASSSTMDALSKS